MPEIPQNIVLPEIVIKAGEEDEKIEDTTSEQTKVVADAGSAAIGAAAKGVKPAGAESHKPKAEAAEPAPKINENMIRGQLSKESDDTLTKIANSPDAGRDPLAGAMAKIARQIIQERKASKPWYGKLW